MQRYRLKNIMEKDSTGILVKYEDAEKIETELREAYHRIDTHEEDRKALREMISLSDTMLEKLKEVISILSDSLLSEKQKIDNSLEILTPPTTDTTDK